MLDLLFSSGILNMIYTLLLLVSFLFAVLTLIGSEIGDALDFDVDADGDGLDLVSISPFAFAMFGASFGLIGLITRIQYNMDAVPSIMWSAGVGLLFGGVAQLVFIYILSPTRSSHFTLTDDAVGRQADVILTIPRDGKGTIAYDNISGRVTLGARSTIGKQIRTGESVRIEKIVGRVAYVRPHTEVIEN